MAPEQEDQQAQAMSMIKAVYDDGEADINGRAYTFTKMVHKERRKVFAFFTKIQKDVNQGNLWFLESPEFQDVEAIIERRITFNGSALSKLPTHWDLYPEDYVVLIQTALGVISYPFLPVSATGSQSQEPRTAQTTSKKPM